MRLQGQAARADGGFAMAGLIAAMAVMAILWSVALPAWTQLARREKEEELIFRGTQYARAISQFQRKYANANPPSLDVLIEQRFLRRKYKDPIVADGDFQLLYRTAQQPGQPGGQQSTAAAPPSSGFGTSTQMTSGGIIGVASKSKETSIRVYNGRTHYNEWQFIPLVTTQAPGAGADGAAGPGGRRGGGPGPGGTPGRRGEPPPPVPGGGGAGPGLGPDRGGGGRRGAPGPGPAGPGGGRGQFPPLGNIFIPAER